MQEYNPNIQNTEKHKQEPRYLERFDSEEAARFLQDYRLQQEQNRVLVPKKVSDKELRAGIRLRLRLTSLELTKQKQREVAQKKGDTN